MTTPGELKPPVRWGASVNFMASLFREERAIVGLEPYFREMRWLTPREPETYLSAARLFRRLRGRGVTIRSMVDCLIATLAEEHRTLLLAKDRDMMQVLGSGLCGADAAPLLER